MNSPLLSIRNLRVDFRSLDGSISAVRGIDLEIAANERIAIVGESGSGKSQLFNALLGLLARNGSAQGEAWFGDTNLLDCNARKLNRIRGNHIGMIFQDPMTSLNPYLTIGRQLTEVLEQHRTVSRSAARRAAIEMLDKVHIPEPVKRMKQYPHQLSGGMRQRIMIAMAMLCQPRLLIADEPTTALDVTIQAEILVLLRELAAGQALAIITHDLNLVGGLCDRVVVMYAGRIVESGSIEDIFYHAAHPYTQGLLRATPGQQTTPGSALYAIPGQPPDPADLPAGCTFHPRCKMAQPGCQKQEPALQEIRSRHYSACPYGHST